MWSLLILIQARWDVNDLHRHPDFAPIKKEPAPNNRVMEDDDLPLPRPAEPARSSAPSHTTAFDGDGEFGSTCGRSISLEHF